jgi:hypothetical protein
LVNPGAVFGTSVTDLENGVKGRTHQGVVIVSVEDSLPIPEFVDTAPRESVHVFDIDVSGRSAEEARSMVARAVAENSGRGALLFPRLHGRLKDGSLGDLGLTMESFDRSRSHGPTVHWDLGGAESAPSADSGEGDVAEAERRFIRELAAETDPALVELLGKAGDRRVRELLQELGTPRGEGEAKSDYEAARRRAGLAILDVQPPTG